MNSPSDRSIAMSGNAVRTGARARFEALCTPLKPDLLRFVVWLCRDRSLAEDIVQETLLRAWRSMDSLQDENATRAWLLTIARREVARVFERKRLATVDIDAACIAEPEALALNDRHDVEEMRRAILRLDQVHREPLVLQVLFGYSTQEIATHLQISVPAVLTRLYRARQVLRKQLTGADADQNAVDEDSRP
jgi:RNA polymerase sigma-70 factor (ECF subfamily)